MNTFKLPRKKSCRICRQVFQPTRAIQPTCGEFECQVAYADQVAAKSVAKRKAADRLETKARREKLKGHNDYVREVDAAFSAFIRYRDKDRTCICCGKPLYLDSIGGSYDAGHFISRKHMATRWDEANVHAQRKYCNRHMAGNYAGFREGLIGRIGLSEVERLEVARKVIRKFNIYELMELRDLFRAKLKELKAQERMAA
jgi:hypothetical protein